MEPEDTDRFKRFEDLMSRLVKVPKKKVDDPEKTESSSADQTETPSEDSDT